MPTRLVKSHPWAEPGDCDEAQVEWNMWQRRFWPFNEIAEGDSILGVTGGPPHEGRIHSMCRVEHLIKAAYETHEDAWRILRTGIPSQVRARYGIDKRGFLKHEYTQKAPASGWLLAFHSVPTRDLSEPRPTDFHLRPNGWGRMQDLPW